MTGMFPLDHIPMFHRDLERLASAFRRMGFFVAPQAQFRSPAAPGGIWTTQGVFFKQGWFDLQAAPKADPARLARPESCLFRAPDLEAAKAALAPLSLDEPFPLTRHWDGRQDASPLRMGYANIRARIAPFMLAVIAYEAPGSDIDEAWTEHPNTAVHVKGISFPAPSPGQAAEFGAKVLDLSEFRYGVSEIAVRIRVADLAELMKALEKGQVQFEMSPTGLYVPPFEALGCGFEFSTQ